MRQWHRAAGVKTVELSRGRIQLNFNRTACVAHSGLLCGCQGHSIRQGTLGPTPLGNCGQFLQPRRWGRGGREAKINREIVLISACGHVCLAPTWEKRPRLRAGGSQSPWPGTPEPAVLTPGTQPLECKLSPAGKEGRGPEGELNPGQGHSARLSGKAKARAEP